MINKKAISLLLVSALLIVLFSAFAHAGCCIFQNLGTGCQASPNQGNCSTAPQFFTTDNCVDRPECALGCCCSLQNKGTGATNYSCISPNAFNPNSSVIPGESCSCQIRVNTGSGNRTGQEQGNGSQMKNASQGDVHGEESQGEQVNLANEQQNQAEETQIQNQERVQVLLQQGEHYVGEGQVLRVQTQSNNRVQLQTGDSVAESDMRLIQEQVQNRTRIMAQLSNGQNADIKVMPDVASQRAMERLRLRVCSEENNCQLELKEIGKGEQVKAVYELKAQKQVKLFGLFRTKMEVQAQINAETGEVIQAKKPWWAFLASEE